MTPLATYLAPPLVGAFIGYMTNYVAIRMLFRPLKPWYLFGIRLPMTPGVIPLKRRQLADNIGEMVGGHLLTSNDVSRALTEESFQRELRELIDGRVEEIMHRQLGPVATVVPERFRPYFAVGIKILRWRTLKHLHSHLRSEAFTQRIAPTIAGHLNEFLARPLNQLLADESRAELAGAFESGIAGFLAGDGVEQWVRGTVNNKVEAFLAADGSLDDILPAGLRELLLDRLEAETPHLITKLAAMLQEPVMQDRIARGVVGAVSTFTASLGPLGAMLGGFLSPDVINDKVRGYLAGKGEEIANWLFDDTVQQKVAVLLRTKATDFLTAPVSRLLDRLTPETVALLTAGLADQAVALLKDPATAKAIANLGHEALESQKGRPLAAILAELFGEDGVTRGVTWTTAEIIDLLRSNAVKRLLDDLITDLVETRILQQPIGSLAEFLPREVRNGIGDYLLQQVSDVLVREVPGLVDSLNIRRIVARKVNSLDLLRLEGLLLSIMEEQFKYINLFGALLGFLIGLGNLAFLSLG